MEAGYPEGFDFELDVLAERYEEALYFARMWEAVGCEHPCACGPTGTV